MAGCRSPCPGGFAAAVAGWYWDWARPRVAAALGARRQRPEGRQSKRQNCGGSGKVFGSRRTSLAWDWNRLQYATLEGAVKRIQHKNDFARAQHRESRHQTAISTSRVVTVNGMPSSALTARHSRIASAMFDSASASVCPWLTQPGIDGHSPMYTPSSS